MLVHLLVRKNVNVNVNHSNVNHSGSFVGQGKCKCQSFGHTLRNGDVDAAKGLIQVTKGLAYICQHCITALVNSF